MTTFLQLAQAAWPGVSDKDADYLLWNRTPFPFDKNPRLLYKKISGYRRACANGLELCDHCSNLAMPGQWNCKRCDDALASVRRDITETPGATK